MRALTVPLFLMMFGSLLLVFFSLSPNAGESAIIIYRPGTAGEDAFAQTINAGWLPLRNLRDSVLLAYPENQAATSRPAGAWLLLNGTALRGCPLL